MSSLKIRALSLLSNILRSFGPLILFAILAKTLPTDVFGEFSLYFAIAGILALIGDYGCSTFSLPILSELDNNVNLKFSELFWFRFLTSIVVMLLGVVLITVFTNVNIVLFYICCGVVFVSSMGDFCLLPFRAVRALFEEALASVLNTSIYVISVVTVAISTKDIIYISIAYLISRCFSLAVIFVLWRKISHRKGLAANESNETRLLLSQQISHGFPYFVDSMLSASINYIDTILINALIGIEAVAKYQIPAKIMQMSLIVVQVCVAIYVPMLVREKDRLVEKKLQRRMIIELTLVGGLLAVGVSLVIPALIEQYFRPEYQLPEAAWVGFAMALWVRLSAAGYGVILISEKRPQIRVIGQVLVLTTFVAGMLVSARQFGLIGVSWSFSAAMFFALLFYRHSVRRLNRV